MCDSVIRQVQSSCGAYRAIRQLGLHLRGEKDMFSYAVVWRGVTVDFFDVPESKADNQAFIQQQLDNKLKAMKKSPVAGFEHKGLQGTREMGFA